MNATRILSFTFCLGLACLLLTGNALAGTTDATEVEVAREIGTSNVVINMPANANTRAMNVIRNANEDFILKVTLGNGAEFAGAGGADNPEDTDLTLSVPAGGAIQATVVAGGADGDTTVDYFVDILTDFTGFPTLSLAFDGWDIRDVSNVLGGGGNVSLTMETRDSATNNVFDSGTDTDNEWLTSDFAVIVSVPLVSATKVVDVAQQRLLFTGMDTTDDGASVGIDVEHPTIIGADGTSYELLAADEIDIVIAGNLSGITTITWDAGVTDVVHVVTATDVTNGSATITLAGTHPSIVGAADAATIALEIDGSTVLSERTITITVNLKLSGGVTGPTANDRAVLGTSTLTVWSLNGTVLIAGFTNGNNGLFNSRVYVFNPSSNAGDISVRVFTLPLSGASTVLGTVDLGSLPAESGKNIRLAEDILTPLAISLPYTADGGNLLLEITVEAEGVEGYGQVFQLDLSSFGIYPLAVL